MPLTIVLVELRGIEPLTSSMRTKRATNCATAPCGHVQPRCATLAGTPPVLRIEVCQSPDSVPIRLLPFAFHRRPWAQVYVCLLYTSDAADE